MDDRISMSATAQLTRNAGPSWGFQFLSRAQRIAPGWLLRPGLMVGTWVAVARMPEQRRHSRDYLTVVLGRPATLLDVWRHFYEFLELLLLRLRIADGTPPRATLDADSAADFETLMAAGEQALFGTFHFGHSDLLGFLLAARGRRVSMIRLRLANSPDTDRFARQFGGSVSFIWVNEPANLLFTLKSAIEAGDSLAMQCDRVEYTAKAEAFEFLGARRIFPFTIYHLAVVFGKPVMFCFGMPDGSGGTRVIATPLYRPDAPTRSENLAKAREHFQGVLNQLERLVRQRPRQWFNFLPLNPVAPAESAKTGPVSPLR
jgi:predicted LPLAT superfamily acyltransferase